MNSMSFQRNEWMAPARRVVVVMTISDDPALALIELSPEAGGALALIELSPEAGGAMASGDSAGMARKTLRFSKPRDTPKETGRP